MTQERYLSKEIRYLSKEIGKIVNGKLPCLVCASHGIKQEMAANGDFENILFCPHCGNELEISLNNQMKTLVVNLRWESYDVYIGRPSIWGNPFEIGRDGTREEVVKKYREWIMNRPKLLAKIKKLRGKRLGCFCYPKACHGDVLVELVEQQIELEDRLENLKR